MYIKYKRKFIIISTAFLAALLFISCAAAPVIKKTRAGDTETIIATQDGKPFYKIVYTFQGDKIVKGEYWEAPKKDNKDAKDKTNIFSNNPVAKKFEQIITGEKVIDTSDVTLDQLKDGYVLKVVKMVKYNSKGLPNEEIYRGYKKIPVIGFFNIKVDRKYKYNDNNQLIQITEKNLNVDTLLLNMGIGNITLINRDASGKPSTVIKTIGSIPPTIEKTDYYYNGNTNHLEKTIYEKAGIDFKKLAVVKEKRITLWYNPNVSWEGEVKYFFDLLDSKSAVSSFLIYDLVNNKKEMDFQNFTKKSKIEQAMLVKDVVMLYKNEMMGPKWRMGDLPDVPKPFLMYKDYTWY